MPCGPAPPRLAQLDGDSPGTVSATYCSSGSVLTDLRLAERVVHGRQRAVHGGAVAGSATHSVRSPPPAGDAVGLVWLVGDLGVQGPEHPGPVKTFQTPVPAWLEQDGGRAGRHAGRRHRGTGARRLPR